MSRVYFLWLGLMAACVLMPTQVVAQGGHGPATARLSEQRLEIRPYHLRPPTTGPLNRHDPGDRRSDAFGERLPILDIDTLLYVDNSGLDRIFVRVNEHRFRFVSDPDEVGRSANAFLIPDDGPITVDIAALIRSGNGNEVQFASQGPPGASAQIILSPVLVVGERVAYKITALKPVPAQFALAQIAPNPFRGRATITYDIPEVRISGVDVFIAVYDALGRQVEVLVDDRRFPGRFTVDWRPAGSAWASGVYYARVIAGDAQQTLPVVLIR
jgi:hypothetical protein